MTLPHGKEISGEQVELVIGRSFALEQFARLCNAIAWAEGRDLGLDQFSFTERVYVKDNGVDGEWFVANPGGDRASPLIKAGLNVFQYKQRDISARSRDAIVAGLRHDLRGAALEVRRRTDRAVDQYVLYTNVDLSHEQKRELRELIAEGYPEQLQVQIIGAAELSAFLNNLPHLRSVYFSINDFATWTKAWEVHNKQAIAGQVPELVGRATLVGEAKTAVDDDALTVILFAGPPDIGKTRVAMESTKHRAIDTIFALNGRSMTVSDLLAARSPGQRIVMVVDDPDQDQIEELTTIAVAEGIKLILTVPSQDASIAMNYGRDPRVKLLRVQPLDESESRKLLEAARATFDYSVGSWVIEQAGGNPGILIVASAVGNNLRVEGPRFLEQVGAALQARAETLLGNQALPSVRALSVMTAVGFRGDGSNELEILCGALGDVGVNQVLNFIMPLARSGFAQISGNYVEVIPPVLANHLAEAALAGRAQELAHLFVTLSPQARARLLRRIRQLRSEVVRRFWDDLFTRGALSTFQGAIAQVGLLRLVAPAVPNRVAGLLHPGLSATSVAERRGLEGTLRRELVWTIDQLLFRSSSAELALRCLALLAEAENERWGNNSTGVFTECFHPGHAQFPLALTRRLAILQGILAPEADKERKLLVIKAAGASFNRWGSHTLRRSEGPEPFDPVSRPTHDEVREYFGGVIDVLRPLVRDVDAEVRARAGEILIESIGEYTVQADPQRGSQMLEEISPQVLQGIVPITLEGYITSLDLAIRTLEGWLPQFEAELARLRALKQAVDAGSFETKVKRWVGSWEHGEQEQDRDGQTVFHSQIEIRELGRLATEDRRLVNDALLAWFTSAEAKRSYEFFYYLGKFDIQHVWQETIEEIGEREGGERVFSSYFGGRSSEDRAGVEARLDELTEAGRVTGKALVGATGHIPGNAAAIGRVTGLILAGKVDPETVERTLLAGGWMYPLTTGEAAELLRTIGGPQMQQGSLVIDFLAMWVHSQKLIEGDLAELAWAVLETHPTSGEAWDFDIVAAALAPNNLDRAFDLLRSYLILPPDVRSWEPLDRHGGNRFWNVLWEADRSRALQILLRVSAEFPLAAWRISWHLPEVLDLIRDHELLLEFARRSEGNAEFASASITAAKEGFWPLAVQILALFPENAVIRRNIAYAAEHMGQVIVGPSSQHYERCALAVTEAIENEATPDRVRPFLRDLEQRLRATAETERHKEENESVNW